MLELYQNSPISDEEKLINFGLYIRSSYLASILFLNEMYEKIIDVPGVIMEFGVWWGANLTLFQSLRAVHEPYNYTRQVIGFDTFTGYPDSMKKEDKNSPFLIKGNYSTTKNYDSYLQDLMQYHELENVMSHKKKFELLKGDVMYTLPKYLKEHPETIISLAYFDLALYEPTKVTLKAIQPHLVRGSILVMDELNIPDLPGETIALKEVIGLNKYSIRRSNFTPDRCYITID